MHQDGFPAPIMNEPQEKAADTLGQPLSFITREMVADVFDSQTRGRKDLSVCFTGHRSLPGEKLEAITHSLDELLEELYLHGYRDFYNGGALGFDILAAERVIALKLRHPDVQLRIIVPCATQSERWSPRDTARYERMLYHADEIRVLSQSYYQGCMQVRNRYLVDHSALCVCYLTDSHGGTMATVIYAQREACPVVNLAMEDAFSVYLQNLRNSR